jgi:hypothetical protein
MVTLNVVVRMGQKRYLSGKQKRGLILADIVQKRILQVAMEMQEFDNDKLGMFDENRAPGVVVIKTGFLLNASFQGELHFDVKAGKIKVEAVLERSNYKPLLSLNVERVVERTGENGIIERHEILGFTRRKPLLGIRTKADVFTYVFTEFDKTVKREVVIEREKGIMTVSEEVDIKKPV